MQITAVSSQAFKVTVTNRVCRMCHTPFFYSRYWKEHGSVNNNGQPDNGACETCNFWTSQAMTTLQGDEAVIVNNNHYRLNDIGMFNFGGRKFRIKFFDGREIVACLSGQGKIPNIFNKYPAFQNNAEMELA